MFMLRSLCFSVVVSMLMFFVVLFFICVAVFPLFYFFVFPNSLKECKSKNRWVDGGTERGFILMGVYTAVMWNNIWNWGIAIKRQQNKKYTGQPNGVWNYNNNEMGQLFKEEEKRSMLDWRIAFHIRIYLFWRICM
ncbi:uncharacterized protein TM35_001341000 [Trypanosoma theileri]|uniref:Uncharacterized protein n=1 Tax=Trypanosoma theileri TaxID=67003 RepID=A0A1X0NDK1_9TRYP|nr:uncharacterized protein TM35_001341000 [Trypanosoma theileri]ORC81008.1 hypothetical protein TM35_001341000 [Trypanosoma theileri]